jgi:hypothetical protein
MAALEQVPAIEDAGCSATVRDRFLIATMVETYERVYAHIFIPGRPGSRQRIVLLDAQQ